MCFLGIKPPRFHKIWVRPDFLGPLGYPAMEKNNKTYKNSGPPKEGLQGTTRTCISIVSCSIETDSINILSRMDWEVVRIQLSHGSRDHLLATANQYTSSKNYWLSQIMCQHDLAQSVCSECVKSVFLIIFGRS